MPVVASFWQKRFDNWEMNQGQTRFREIWVLDSYIATHPGSYGMDMQLHITAFCGMWLCIHAVDTIFWCHCIYAIVIQRQSLPSQPAIAALTGYQQWCVLDLRGQIEHPTLRPAYMDNGRLLHIQTNLLITRSFFFDFLIQDIPYFTRLWCNVHPALVTLYAIL